ncbi:MAG: succinylglutamate desuccinylase/aspartoacylase family protein [Candidatus Sericytochromatia bacterium]
MAKVNKQAPFVLGATEIAPGTRDVVELPVAYLYTHHDVTMPVQVVHGRRPGPTLFVSAALHGDEINGVEIIARLLQLRLLNDLCGTLLAIPVVNVHGFLNHSRYLPDRRDLNRSFPGSRQGSMAARLAALFVSEIVSRSTHGVDLHTGAQHRSNLPQVRADLNQPGLETLAKAFGAPLVLHSGVIEGSLREVAQNQGLPLLVYECGEALRFDEAGIQFGVRGLVALMRHLEMLPQRKASGRHTSEICRASRWVRAPIGGVLRSSVKLGDLVAANTCMGYVSHPLGSDRTPVFSGRGGRVIGLTHLPLVDEGNALFHLATLTSEPSESAEPVPAEVSPEDDLLRQTASSPASGSEAPIVLN